MKQRHILFHAPGATEVTFFGRHARDNVAGPFIDFRERCKKLGYSLEITRHQALHDCEWIVFWDVSSLGPLDVLGRVMHFGKKLLGRVRGFRDVYHEALLASPRPRMALIVAEPPSIARRNVRTDAHTEMDVVFTWNEEWLARGGKYVRIHLPVPDEFPKAGRIAFDERKLLVDISANKFSSHPRELYSARRTAIRYFERRFPDDFDLFGIGWNGGRVQSFGTVFARDRHRYRSYRGPVENKWDVLPRYRFVICYENAIFDDYVSQRIFDVLRCNAVPVYWGAPNIEKYVDPRAFVDRRRFSSNEELAAYLESVSRAEYDDMLAAGAAYLQSEHFQRFLGSAWGDTVESALKLRAPATGMLQYATAASQERP
jgi:hypothetical protein